MKKEKGNVRFILKTVAHELSARDLYGSEQIALPLLSPRRPTSFQPVLPRKDGNEQEGGHVWLSKSKPNISNK